MGVVHVDAIVTNSIDIAANEEGRIAVEDIRSLNVPFLADTGAAMICLPIDMIDQLGLKPAFTRQAMTANGTVERRIFSPVRLNIMDREVDLNVMELPVGTPPLLGFLALEALDLIVNPITQRVEGNPEHDGKMLTYLL